MQERAAEAQPLVPRAWAARRRFGTPVGAPFIAALALLQRRFEAAAMLAGHARESYASRGIEFSPHQERLLADIEQAVAAALGAARADALVQSGRSLDDEAAGALSA